MTASIRVRVSLDLIAVALILASGCGGDSSSPTKPSDSGTQPPGAAARVDVSPSKTSVLEGAAVQLSATVRGSDGSALPDRVIVWASSDATTASVTQSGMVSALRAGTATITATSDGLTGSAAI